MSPDIILMSLGSEREKVVIQGTRRSGVVCTLMIYKGWTKLQDWADMHSFKKAKTLYEVQFCVLEIVKGKKTLVVSGIPQQAPFGGFSGPELVELELLIKEVYEATCVQQQ